MDDEKTWRESVRKAANLAAESGLINMSGLAKAAGWSHPQLVNFREKGTGKHEKVEALERELQRLGFFKDHWLNMSRELHGVADFIAGSASDAEKRQRLDSFTRDVRKLFDTLKGTKK